MKLVEGREKECIDQQQLFLIVKEGIEWIYQLLKLSNK